MGSWNKTCGLSNLPIRCGDRVYVFVLEQNDEIDSHCYATHLYSPLLLPFESTYNDYGGGEDSAGPCFDLIMNGLKDCLVEQEQGENPYHDIPVTKAAWNEELFFDSVHEGRLVVKNLRGRKVRGEFAMMRKDLVDDILQNYQIEQYVGEGQGTGGWKNSYVWYGFKDILADIRPMLEVLGTDHLRRLSFDIHISKLFTSPNRAASWMDKCNAYRYSRIVDVKDLAVDWLTAGKIDETETLLAEHLKAAFIDDFLEANRKSWIPGGHEGSQSQDPQPYRALMNAMDKILKAEFKSNNDDEE